MIEDLAFEANFGGHGASAIGQHHRGQQIGRLIDQFAGEVLRVRREFFRAPARLASRIEGDAASQEKNLERPGFLRRRLVNIRTRSCRELRPRPRLRRMPSAPSCSHQASVFTPFCFSERTAEPTARRSAAASKAARFPAPTTTNRFAASLELDAARQARPACPRIPRGAKLLHPSRHAAPVRPEQLHLQNTRTAIASACTRSNACEIRLDSMIVYSLVMVIAFDAAQGPRWASDFISRSRSLSRLS